MRREKAMTVLWSGLTALGLLVPALTVHAETYYGDDGWNVVFTSESSMESSFNTADINDVVGGMQPGDNVIITLDLKNENQTATDWYMRNEVLYSLEDRSTNQETGGGAYTYRLAYTDRNGDTETLFDSDTVGGESAADTISRMGEGLKGATNALKNYFYLDTLDQGSGGVITLEVALDGETQGNDYQNTLADLQMNFAVELQADEPGSGHRTSRGPGNSGNPENPENPGTTGESSGNVNRTGVVRTNDNSQILLYTAVSGICGLALLLWCICSFREHKRRREEA